MTRAIFAIPGDETQRTGGYLYDATVLRLLNEGGTQTTHLRLPDSFPAPSPQDMRAAIDALCAIPADQPVIVDGLALGAMDPEGLARMKAPLVALVHHPLGLEPGLQGARATHLKQNEAAVLAHAAHVIVPSGYIGRLLASEFGIASENITVAQPGAEQALAQRTPSSPPLIMSVGVLALRKGHDVLIDALAQITDLPWRAEIIGKPHEPETAQALSTQITESGLTSRVMLTGELDNDALHTRYQQASIFALATRYEGYGIVFNEAMSYGLPIVSCAVGAVIDTVDEAGILVPRDDATALADAIRRILTDSAYASELAHKSSLKAAALPSWEDTAALFRDVLLRVTK